MVANRLRGEDEFAGNCLVVEASGHQLQDVELAGAQLRERRRDGGGTQLSKLGHALRDSVVEDYVSGYHRLENPFDVSRVGTFDDVSTGTISYRRDGRVVVLGHGEYDDFHGGVSRRQPSVHF